MNDENKIIKIIKKYLKQLEKIKYLMKKEPSKYYKKVFEVENELDLRLDIFFWEINKIWEEKKLSDNLIESKIQEFSSLVVKLINNYHYETFEIEQDKRKGFIKKIKVDFMEGIEEPWCNNAGVAILPYVLKDNKYYYLLVKENNPLFKNKQISEYSTITGGLENHDMTQTVINEMKEEVGIDITNECEAIVHFLGNSFANKSSTKLWNYFAIDLTKMNLDLTITYKGMGDGTKAEKSINGKFVTEEELSNCNDSLSLVVFAKFLLHKDAIKQDFNIQKINNQAINTNLINQSSTSKGVYHL